MLNLLKETMHSLLNTLACIYMKCICAKKNHRTSRHREFFSYNGHTLAPPLKPPLLITNVVVDGIFIIPPNLVTLNPPQNLPLEDVSL